jgi:hypothetical protein
VRGVVVGKQEIEWWTGILKDLLAKVGSSDGGIPTRKISFHVLDHFSDVDNLHTLKSRFPFKAF